MVVALDGENRRGRYSWMITRAGALRPPQLP